MLRQQRQRQQQWWLLLAWASALAPSPSGAVCPTCRWPDWSWETIPVFFHSSMTSGPEGGFTEAQLDVIERFPLVTIEKWQGVNAWAPDSEGGRKPVFVWEEDSMARAAAQAKRRRPNASVVVWLDATMIYTGWNWWPTGPSLQYKRVLEYSSRYGTR